MAKVTGLQVILKANTGTPESPTYTVVGGQKDGSINITGDAIDVSSKDGDGWKEFLLGLKGWDMDLDGVIKENDAGAQALIDAYFAGDEILVKAEFPDGSYYTGNAVVVSMPIKAPMGSDATFSFKIQGTGALTPVTATVTAPTLTLPTLDDTDVAVDATFTTGAFAYSAGTDTHAASQWQVTTNADTTFATPFIDDETTVNKTSKKIADGLLSAGTEYRARVRHKGTLLGWSNWSVVHHFTTAS